MSKKWTALLLALLVSVQWQLTAFAYFSGGDFSDTTVSFGMVTEDAVLVYGNEVEENPITSFVYAGSKLYIPVAVIDYNGSGDEKSATEKLIKEHAVTASYKATVGSQYIKDVSIVEGKKAKVKGVPSGAMVCVSFVDNYTNTSRGDIDMKLVLSVNKQPCQETRVQLKCSIINHMDTIDASSVYSVQGPAQFNVRPTFAGEVSFDFGGGVIYSARVQRSAKYYLNLSRAENTAIAAMYKDVNAYLEYYSFLGDRDTFASTGKLLLPVQKNKFKGPDGTPQVYVYEIVENQLKSLGNDVLSYDAATETITLRTQTLGNYILSSRALMQQVDSTQENIIRSGYATADDLNDNP